MYNHLKSYNILSQADIKAFEEICIYKTLQKGDFFIEAGKICQEVAFIKSGLLRSFYINEKGEDITYCISFPNNFMTAYSSYITQMTTIENIQAFTTTELVILNKYDIEKIAEKSVSAMKFLKTIAEQGYIELEKRIFLYQKGNAQEKYYDLLKNHPDYILQIPQQYLASYLGITPRHLSRLRKEVNL